MGLYDDVKAYNGHVLEQIHNGIVYGNPITDVKYPYFSECLYLTNHGYIGFTHYGSSAADDTISDLAWILAHMFKMSPCEFISKFSCEHRG